MRMGGIRADHGLFTGACPCQMFTVTGEFSSSSCTNECWMQVELPEISLIVCVRERTPLWRIV